MGFINRWRNAAVAIVLAAQGLHAFEQELETRDVQLKRAEAIPAPISIAPSQYWDGNDGLWSSFPLQVGGARATTQAVRVFISTAAYNIWTIGPKGCPNDFVQNCGDKRGYLFYPNQSLTWISNSIFSTSIEANLGLDTTAPAGYDQVTLGWQGSDVLIQDHSVVFNVYDQRYWLGLFGLNPQPTNFTNLNDPQKSFMQKLYESNTIPGLSYGYTAGNRYRFDKVFGSLTIGGTDINRYSGGISWGMYADISRDLLVNIKSISTNMGTSGQLSIGNDTSLLPDGQISAYVDSTIPTIWLPQSSCAMFVRTFGLIYNNTLGYHVINDTTHQNLIGQNPSITFTLTNGTSDVDIILPYAAFDLNLTQPIVPNSQYYFPLQCAANDTQHTLGRTFLQEAYLTADYDRKTFTVAPCTWDPIKVGTTALRSILSPNNTILAASQSQSSMPTNRVSGGAIAGIVVGAVVVITMLIALLLFIRKRRSEKYRKVIEPDTPSRAETMELGDAKVEHEAIEVPDHQLNELHAHHKPKAQEMESPYKVDPNKHGYFEMNGSQEQFGHGEQGRHEMEGVMPIYEMQGSQVQEMPAREKAPHVTVFPRR